MKITEIINNIFYTYNKDSKIIYIQIIKTMQTIENTNN